MGIKADAYIKDLCHYLDINSIGEIDEKHSEKLIEYVRENEDKGALKDILKTIPNFISFAKDSINIMKEIVKEIAGISKVEIEALHTIIVQLENSLKDNDLTEKQKDKIIELQFKYQTTLDELLRRNHELKKIMVTGAITLAAMALTLTGFWVSSISKGKINAEVLEESAQKLIEKA